MTSSPWAWRSSIGRSPTSPADPAETRWRLRDPDGVDSAAAWKQYYADERRRLGPDALLKMVDEAAPLELRPGGAIVIPHTRIQVTGDQIASAEVLDAPGPSWVAGALITV